MAKLYNLARMTTATVGTGTITLGSAKAGYLSFASAGVSNGDVIAYAITDGANAEIGYGVYTSSGTTLTRNVRNSTNSNNAISLSGNAEVAITPAAQDLVSMTPPQGRLTLTTGTPVMTSTASGQTTVYYTPHVGRFAPRWTGSHFEMADFGGELSQATSDSSKSPAAVTTNSLYDMFLWLDGSTWRCTRGPAWTSTTGRGTGAGTTELELLQGYWVNKIDVTNGPAARYGVYVGTIRTNASSQVDWIYGGASAGGTAAHFGVWNAYNQVSVSTQVSNTTATWTYNSATKRQPNGSTTMRVYIVRGLNNEGIQATYSVNANPPTGGDWSVAISVDGSTTPASPMTYVDSTNSVSQSTMYVGYPGLGWRYVNPLEWQLTTGPGAVDFFGTLSGDNVCVLSATLFA